MALFFVNLKNFSRGKGQSSVNAAAYRAGSAFTDHRTGVLHNYSKKAGVLDVSIRAPAHAPAWIHDPEKLWNGAESGERKNGRTARELLTTLPPELSQDQIITLANAITQHLVDSYGVAAMCCVHAADPRGDARNRHAHILFTTRQITASGFGLKTRVLDDRKTGPEQIEALRAKVAEITNTHLAQAGVSERIDHRSLEKQSMAAEERGDLMTALRLARETTEHEGQHATAARRRGESTAQTRANDLIKEENARRFEIAVRRLEQPGDTITVFGPSKPTRGIQSRIRTRSHVEGKERATGKDAELLNAQARALQASTRVDAQLAYEYQQLIEEIIKSLGNRAQEVFAYAQRCGLSMEDTIRLAEHRKDPKLGILLRQALAAENGRRHASILKQRRHDRYGRAMVRTQQARNAFNHQTPGAPRSKRDWAQLRRAQQRALLAAERNEARARRLSDHEADYRAGARVQAATDRLREIEAKRRQDFPLPGDTQKTSPNTAAPVPLGVLRVPLESNRRALRPQPGRR